MYIYIIHISKYIWPRRIMICHQSYPCSLFNHPKVSVVRGLFSRGWFSRGILQAKHNRSHPEVPFRHTGREGKWKEGSYGCTVECLPATYLIYIYTQIIATPDDVTPKGSLVLEFPLFQGISGRWRIIICADCIICFILNHIFQTL